MKTKKVTVNRYEGTMHFLSSFCFYINKLKTHTHIEKRHFSTCRRYRILSIIVNKITKSNKYVTVARGIMSRNDHRKTVQSST